MKNFSIFLTSLVLSLVCASANAVVVQFTIDDADAAGNDCAGYYGDNFESCVISSEDGTGISSIIAKLEIGEGGELWETNENYPDFDEDLVHFTPDNPDATASGSWVYDGNSMIRFWVIKHGDRFTVFYDTDDESCALNPDSTACMESANVVDGGEWSVSPSSFSHITFYDSEIRVPEPGTLALFGLGLLGMGMSRRRRIS